MVAAEHLCFRVSDLGKLQDLRGSGRITDRDRPQEGLVLTVDGEFTGFIRVLSLLKLLFFARFTLLRPDAYEGKSSRWLFYPTFEESVAGLCVFQAAALNGVNSITAPVIGQFRIFGKLFVLLGRRPAWIDLRFLMLRIAQIRLFAPLVHNGLTSRLLAILSEERKPRRLRTLSPSKTSKRGTILSIVNSRKKAEYGLYCETIGASLRQYGFHFREHDLLDGIPERAELRDAPLVVVGQPGILSDLVQTGMPFLPSKTHMLTADAMSLLQGEVADWIGVEPPEGGISTKSVTVEGARNAIPLSGKLRFLIPANLGSREEPVLLSSEDRRIGMRWEKEDGSVLTQCYPNFERLTRDVGGPRPDLSIFERLIITSARKPIVQMRCPRFLFLKLDDFTLEQSTDHLHEIESTGIFSNVGLFTGDTPVEKLTGFSENGTTRVVFTPHSTGWKQAFWWDVVRNRPHRSEVLADTTNYLRSYFQKANFSPSSVTHSHFYAMNGGGKDLRDLGIKAMIKRAEGDEESLPVGNPSYGWGHTHDGLFRMSFEDDNRYRYSLGNRWDFLKRCATLSGRGDLDGAVERGFLSVRDAFLAGYPAILSTHEYRMLRFRPSEIGQVIRRILERLDACGLRPVLATDAEVSEYLQAYAAVDIEEVINTGSRISMRTHKAASQKIHFIVHKEAGVKSVLLAKGEHVLDLDLSDE